MSSPFLAFGPHAGSHRVAARAGVSVLVPLLLLWALDRQSWSIYAAFGAFTSLYGRHQADLSRSRMQAIVGVLLTAVTTLGVVVGLSGHRAWLAVLVATLVAAAGSLVADAQAWHPPGPFFLVFAFAACASIPSSPPDVLVALLVAGSSAAFAVLVGGLGGAARRWGGQDPTAARTVRPPSVRRPFSGDARRHLLRNALAVLVAGSVATASSIGHPYWAVVSAVVPLAAVDWGSQLVRGLQRVAGTLVGLVAAAGLLALDPSGLVLILVIGALQVAAELVVGRNYAVALVAITPLALLMVHLAAPVPARTLLEDRGVETVIGVSIGLAVGYLTRRRAR